MDEKKSTFNSVEKRDNHYSHDYLGGGYSKHFGTNFQEMADEQEPGEHEQNVIGFQDTEIKADQSNVERYEIIKKVKKYKGGLQPSELPHLNKKTETTVISLSNFLSPSEGNLKAAVPNGKSFYVTSCFPREGKTTATIALAYHLSVFSDRTVLLVDAHFTSPVVHRIFNVSDKSISNDFKEILLEPSSLIQGIMPTIYENLFILPTMPKQGSPVLGITTAALGDFMKRVSNEFDYIFFDGRPIMSAPEPLFFASVVDGVIMVVESEKTKWEVVQTAIEKVQNIKAKMAGVVLNRRKLYIPPAIYKLL